MKIIIYLYTLFVFSYSNAFCGIENNFCEKTLKVSTAQEDFVKCPVVGYESEYPRFPLVPYDNSLQKYDIKPFKLKNQVVVGAFAVYCFAKTFKKISSCFKNNPH